MYNTRITNNSRFKAFMICKKICNKLNSAKQLKPLIKNEKWLSLVDFE